MDISLENAYMKYENKAEQAYYGLCRMQKMKYWGIMISAVLSPIAILLYVLEGMGMIHLLKFVYGHVR